MTVSLLQAVDDPQLLGATVRLHPVQRELLAGLERNPNAVWACGRRGRNAPQTASPAPNVKQPSGGVLAAALLADLDDDALEVLAARLSPWLGVPADTPEPWVDVKAAAAHLSCPVSRLYALVSARRIPHCKDGSRVLFRRSELDAWVRSGGGRRP
jgi:excisionase family DNA binding protein